MFWRLFLPFTLLLRYSAISQYENFGPAIYQLTEPIDHGEGPSWDSDKGLLFFVDLENGRICSYDPKTAELFFVQLQGTVTPVVSASQPDKFLVGVNRSVVEIIWDGKSEIKESRWLTTVANQFPDSRFNDGKVDSKGRLWFGTMGHETSTSLDPNAGLLYLITQENLSEPEVLIAPVNVSNGMAWNKADTKFYYIDTPTYKIIEYDYDDSKQPKISNPRVVIDFTKAIGEAALPDGMTIDIDDNLWVALYGGGSVVQVNPRTGEVMRRVALPSKYVTSVMWGGENYEVLFVTTSRLRLNDVERGQQPAAGSLFAITGLGTTGLPVNKADF